MADLNIAFGSPFKNSCSLKFDVCPTFDSDRNVEATRSANHWLGIVTLQDMVGKISEFSYEVFSTQSDASAFPIVPEKKCVIRGTVSNSNNPTFTFPITQPPAAGLQSSVATFSDYFVLVKPVYEKPCESPSQKQEETFELGKGNFSGDIRGDCRTSEQRHIPVKEEFAIFYTSRVMKRRKEIMQSIKTVRGGGSSFTCAVPAPTPSGKLTQRRVNIETPVMPANDVDEVARRKSEDDDKFKIPLPPRKGTTTASSGFSAVRTNSNAFKESPFDTFKTFHPANTNFEVPPFAAELDDSCGGWIQPNWKEMDAEYESWKTENPDKAVVVDRFDDAADAVE